jgi:flavin reductase (DIM6/NTAB) family NADH-FMN oxidoreductase RutF
VIDKTTFTRELVAASGTFGLCLPGTALADATYAAGSRSGREGDKFELLGLRPLSGPVLGVPVLEDGCAAWMECRLIPEPHAQQAYDTCFADVVSAAADPALFREGHWDFRADNAGLQTIHHLGAGLFVRAGGTVQARLP